MAERETELLRNGSGYVDPTAYKALKKVETEMSANGGAKMTNEFKPGEIWEGETERNETVYYLIVGVQNYFCNVLKLKRFDEKHPENTRGNIEVIAKGIMYTDAGMISYASKRKLTGFVRRLTDEEFTTVKTCILEKLRFDEFLTFDSRTAVDVEEENDLLKRKLIKQNELREDAEKQILSLQEQIDRIKSENEMELGAYNENLKMLGSSISDLESKLEEAEKTRDGLMHEVDRLNAELMIKTGSDTEFIKMQVERDFYKEQYEKLFQMVTGAEDVRKAV